MRHYWAVKWVSENTLDGRREYYVGGPKTGAPGPRLFATRREAREWRDQRYGYFRNRPDLKAEPHGWSLPRVEKVTVIIVAAGA